MHNRTKFAIRVYSALVAGAIGLLGGCATTDGAAITLASAAAPAVALDPTPYEMVIAVSPTRQTMQLLGTTGTVLGAGVSAVQNEKYRAQVQAALGDYDGTAQFLDAIYAALDAPRTTPLARVEALTSTAGHQSKRDADAARYDRLANRGYDSLLDLDVMHGLFGVDGDLVAQIEGKLVMLPSGHALWRDTLQARPGPLYANTPLGDSTQRMTPNFGALRLSAHEDAVSRWTRDGRAAFQASLAEAFSAAAAMLAVSLGVSEDARGAYYLGKQAVIDKEFAEAATWFDQALAWDPGYADALNGKAVALAHHKQLEHAVGLAERLAAGQPEYAPVHYNLAWWKAERGELEAARSHYERALALGERPDPELEQRLKRIS